VRREYFHEQKSVKPLKSELKKSQTENNTLITTSFWYFAPMAHLLESMNSSILFPAMLCFYASLQMALLALYAAGEFPVIILTTTIEPDETRKGRFLEVTRRELWFRKGPIRFIIGSYAQTRPANEG
jgi:hypothetical protein